MTPVHTVSGRNSTDRLHNEQRTSRSPRSLHLLLITTMIALLVSGLALLLGSPFTTLASSTHQGKGYVYILNNNLAGSNSITVFTREQDGSLKLSGTKAIGGQGSLTAFADGTQGSLILAHGKNSWLFAADAGSNQVSVVKVHDGRLSLVGIFPSGGAGPVSLTYHNGLLYVLNAANGRTQAATLAGFRVDDEGRLHPIAGATQSLSAAHPNPAQVQIDPSGRWLVVTEKVTNLIDVYRVGKDGSLSAPVFSHSVGLYPFGMAFNPARPRELLVDDGFGVGGKNPTGAVTAYRLTGGAVQLVNGPVPDYQIAPCWMAITRDGRYAYTSNADSHSISGYRIDGAGRISLMDAKGLTASTPADTFPLEEGLSGGDKYLYVLDSRLLLKVPGPVTLSGFLIHYNGSLTSVVNPASIALPFSSIGLAAE